MNNLIFDRSKASVDLQEKVGQFFYNNQAVLNVNKIGEGGQSKWLIYLPCFFNCNIAVAVKVSETFSALYKCFYFCEVTA